MARAAIQWRRRGDGNWGAVGVWLGTRTSLMSRFLPDAQLQDFVRRNHVHARPPTGSGGVRGTWEDWIEYALDALSNGHDLMVSEVEPEPTVDRLYAREVLGLAGAALDGVRLAGPVGCSVVEVTERVGADSQRRSLPH